MQGWMERGCMCEVGGRKRGKSGWWDEWVVVRTGWPASQSQGRVWREAQGPPALSLSGPTAPVPAGPREEDPEKTEVPQRRCSCLTFTLSCPFSISAGTPG